MFLRGCMIVTVKNEVFLRIKLKFLCLSLGLCPLEGVFENHEEVRQAHEVPEHGKRQVTRL